jgi:hypothetical protein
MPTRGRSLRSNITTIAEVVGESGRRHAGTLGGSVRALRRGCIELGRVSVVARERQGIVEGERRGRGWEADSELEGRGRLRRVLEVLKTILHVGEGGIHGIDVGGGLRVEVEGEQLRGRHREEREKRNRTKTRNRRAKDVKITAKKSDTGRKGR